MAAPNRNRMALLTWAVIYPMITSLLAVLEPFLAGMPLPVRSLVLTGILVPVMVYIVMPLATQRFSAWLNSRES
ncbi:MAG: hypothetical protein AAFN16_15270 [Pseudomonadota bacterium]